MSRVRSVRSRLYLFIVIASGIVTMTTAPAPRTTYANLLRIVTRPLKRPSAASIVSWDRIQ
jgi:hypothetical protein